MVEKRTHEPVVRNGELKDIRTTTPHSIIIDKPHEIEKRMFQGIMGHLREGGTLKGEKLEEEAKKMFMGWHDDVHNYRGGPALHDYINNERELWNMVKKGRGKVLLSMDPFEFPRDEKEVSMPIERHPDALLFHTAKDKKDLKALQRKAYEYYFKRVWEQVESTLSPRLSQSKKKSEKTIIGGAIRRMISEQSLGAESRLGLVEKEMNEARKAGELINGHDPRFTSYLINALMELPEDSKLREHLHETRCYFQDLGGSHFTMWYKGDEGGWKSKDIRRR